MLSSVATYVLTETNAHRVENGWAIAPCPIIGTKPFGFATLRPRFSSGEIPFGWENGVRNLAA